MEKRKIPVIITFVIIVIIILSILILTIHYSFKQETTELIVLDISENGTIGAVDNEDPQNMYYLNIHKINIDYSEIKPGYIIKVYYDGVILESFPAQFSSISKIRIMEEADIEKYKIGLSTYITFLEDVSDMTGNKDSVLLNGLKETLDSLQ